MSVIIDFNGKSIIGITSLNKIQRRILQILGVSKEIYSVDAFIPKSGET